MKKIKALRGMRDILPGEIEKWQAVEATSRSIFDQYGYEEIRTPIIEETPLFKRSIGADTDIVQKQMYSFKDSGGRELTMRPEGTAPVVRVYLEHNLDAKLPICKLFYIGPMFRNERPQAGRLRQFYQIGAEAIGSFSPYLDAEMISVMMKILEAAGLSDVELRINSLGCGKDKREFAKTLKRALASRLNHFCEDCKKRYERNILRLFDCKNSTCRESLDSAPKITDYLCQDCKAHFDEIKEILKRGRIKYTLEPCLVRGLDYYTGVVFEVSHKNLGSQDAVAAGGRYDNLIEDMGGKKTPACGFAIGFERLLIAAGDRIKVRKRQTDIFLIGLGKEAKKKTFEILSDLRNKGIRCQMGFDEKSLKSQMRLANRIGAKKVLIIGEAELESGKAILRDMEKREQRELRLEDAADTHLW